MTGNVIQKEDFYASRMIITIITVSATLHITTLVSVKLTMFTIGKVFPAYQVSSYSSCNCWEKNDSI